jgi:hypothetical protein
MKNSSFYENSLKWENSISIQKNSHFHKIIKQLHLELLSMQRIFAYIRFPFSQDIFDSKMSSSSCSLKHEF